MLQAGMSRVRIPMRWIFFSSIYLIQPHCGPGGNSASNGNEYQESSWGIKGGRRIRLTTLPQSVRWLSRQNVGASTSHNLWAFTAGYRIALPFFSYPWSHLCWKCNSAYCYRSLPGCTVTPGTWTPLDLCPQWGVGDNYAVGPVIDKFSSD
jgi:hypothetical protein